MSVVLDNGVVVKHAGGRPPKYPNVQMMADKIDDYFNTITITRPAFEYVASGDFDDDGKEILDKVPRLNNAGKQIMSTEYLEIPSILGMCLFLDIDRRNLLEYECKEEFRLTIKKAKEKVEQYLADQLHRTTQVAGIIFNLKNNFGWKDTQSIEVTGPNGGPILTQSLNTLDITDLLKLEEIMAKALPEVIDIEPNEG